MARSWNEMLPPNSTPARSPAAFGQRFETLSEIFWGCPVQSHGRPRLTEGIPRSLRSLPTRAIQWLRAPRGPAPAAVPWAGGGRPRVPGRAGSGPAGPLIAASALLFSPRPPRERGRVHRGPGAQPPLTCTMVRGRTDSVGKFPRPWMGTASPRIWSRRCTCSHVRTLKRLPRCSAPPGAGPAAAAASSIAPAAEGAGNCPEISRKCRARRGSGRKT